jgi:hypothetical protein
MGEVHGFILGGLSGGGFSGGGLVFVDGETSPTLRTETGSELVVMPAFGAMPRNRRQISHTEGTHARINLQGS